MISATRYRIIVAATLAVTFACTSGSSSAPEPSAADASDDAQATADAAAADDPAVDAAAPEACATDWQVERLTTEDGIELVADFRSAASPNRGAVVLFHMVPPHFDRSSYPLHIRDALGALDISVLNVDRRGAGDSGGEATDAYEGPGARLDMEAAVRFLVGRDQCAPDPERILLVGASNGTTATLDYLVAHAAELPTPAAVAWLSPGDYTQNQHTIADNRTQLDATPILWVYPDEEPFAEDFGPNAPAAWRFVRLEGGGHGTENLDGGDLEEEVRAELVGWAEQHVAGD